MEKIEKLNKTEHKKFLSFLMNKRKTIEVHMREDPETQNSWYLWLYGPKKHFISINFPLHSSFFLPNWLILSAEVHFFTRLSLHQTIGSVHFIRFSTNFQNLLKSQNFYPQSKKSHNFDCPQGFWENMIKIINLILTPLLLPLNFEPFRVPLWMLLLDNWIEIIIILALFFYSGYKRAKLQQCWHTYW